MILLILIQRPQGGGLSGAFGAGGGAGQTAFGTKTGDVLTMVTIAIFVLFLVAAIVLNFAARPSAPPPGTTAQRAGRSRAETAQTVEATPSSSTEMSPGDLPAGSDQTGPAPETDPDGDRARRHR
jgi:preprotein translocase subunit SecG